MHKTVTQPNDPYMDAASLGLNSEDTPLTMVNQVRQSVGLGAVQSVPQLQSMVNSHTNYLSLYRSELSNGHQELPSHDGYTGRDLKDRIEHFDLATGYFGYDEVVTYEYDPQTALAHWLYAVYHRPPILSPTARYMSYAHRQGPHEVSVLVAMHYVETDGLSAVVYPGQGQSVPASFQSDREVPDPVPEADRVGMPVSVHFPRDYDQKQPPEIVQFQLTGADGALVSAQLLTCANDLHLECSDVFLVPHSPLRPASTYQVSFKGTYRSEVISKHWWFQTRGVTP